MSDSTTLRLLLVEDDPVMRLGLTRFFESEPRFIVVGQAADGDAAVQTALQLQPDIIVMDVGLPRLDGIAATQQIKAVLPQVRVVMLTSHHTETEIIAALASGADAYCIKGTSLTGLVGAIAAACEGAVYLDPQIARRVIQHFKPPTPNVDVHLSDRELEVLRLMVEGHSNPEIAAALYLSISTVKAHIRNVMSKLAVDDRVQAAVVALRSGLV